MAVNVSEIQEGMEAHTSDNKKLGSVVEVQARTDGTVSVVIETKGIFGGKGTQLFIPHSQVESIVPSERITLYCAASEAHENFCHPPSE